MNTKINRLKWKSRRGMRELDLLLREFCDNTLNNLSKKEIDTFEEFLNYDDQRLYDHIFKNIPLDKKSHDDFVKKHIKSHKKMNLLK